MDVDCLAFPAVLIRDGRVVEGFAELVQLIDAVDVRWCHVTGPMWLSASPPWRVDETWNGEVDAISSHGARRFRAACARARDGLLWQFVEESVAARQHRLISEAVDALPDAFSITTSALEQPGPQFVFVNQAFTKLMGWTAEEVHGRTPRLLQGPKTDRVEIDRLVTCLRAGEPFHGGAINYRKTGEPFWNEWNITTVPGRDGWPSHFVSLMRDATSSRVARHRVESAATEWASIIDALDTNVILTHEDGTIARCNRAFADLLELEFVEIVGASLAGMLFGPGHDTLPLAMFHARPDVIRIERLGGWFAVDGRPVCRRGQVVGWVHTLSNATPSQQTAEQLHQLAAAAEQANDGIVVLDLAARIAYLNPALARMLARERASLLHQEISCTGLLPDIAETLEVARARGACTIRLELSIPGDRRCSLEVIVTRILSRLHEPDGYVLIVRDQTEREHLWRIAEHASTLGNIGNWLGGLRHELGNPVASIKMALTVLQAHLPSLTTQEAMRLIERAVSELGRLEFLLRTLKTFSLYDSLERESIAINPFFARLADLLELDLGRAGIQLTLDSQADLAIYGDRRALHQVFVNLIGNAMDATAGTGGVITLEARARGALVELVVRDNGVGMSPGQLDRMFHPFETTKAHGTGLGLVLVRRLVTSMRGDIRAASVVGQGTALTLTFEVGA